MTATIDTPQPPAPVPGVDRRHRPADFFHERTNFQFIARSRNYLVITLIVIIGGIAVLGIRGLNLGIDFEGGVSWQVDVAKGANPSVANVRDAIDKIGLSDYKATIGSSVNGKRTIRVQARVVNDTIEDLRQAVADATGKKLSDINYQASNGSATITAANVTHANQTRIQAAVDKVKLNTNKAVVTVRQTRVSVKLDRAPPSVRDEVTKQLAALAKVKDSEVSISTVGPTWGKQVSQKAIKALIVFFFVLAVYLTIRFELKMSVAAIVAVIHDIIFTVAMYSLTQFNVSPATVTAFLTILGFSLYDTVVVFDKIKENQATLLTSGRTTYSDMANRSLNQVLMRSLSTSFVALMPVLSLLLIGSGLFGAVALKDFALALFAGLFIGTYSSIFVAAPLLVWWKEREPQNRALQERRVARAAATAAQASKPRLAVATSAAAVDDDSSDWDASGVPGPPAVGRSQIAPRPRQQRGAKRRKR